MQQIRNRILHAQLRLDQLRLDIIRRYPVPVMMDFGDIPEERKNFLVRVLKAVHRMGSRKAVVDCGLYTEEQVEDAIRTTRDIIISEPVPSEPSASPPHPLDDPSWTGQSRHQRGRE